MASLDLPPATPSKVTLTNWVRLNNAPLLLPRASAVQWNDYVFVLASDGTALLYHAKHGMWSMLPKCPIEQLDGAPPLTVHKGEVITLSKSDQASFDFHLGEWKTQCNGLKLLTNGGSYEKTNKIVIASSEGSLYAIVEWTEEQKIEYNPYTKKKIMETTEHCDVLRSETKWETVCRIKKNQYRSSIAGTAYYTTAVETSTHKSTHLESAAIAGTNLYVRTDDRMCQVRLVTEEEEVENKTEDKAAVAKVKTTEFLPVSHCSKPPHPGSTLHAVKNTLFSFGGRDKDNQPTSDVLRYNPDTDTWASAGYMRSARYNAAVATVNQAENLDVIVIGGSFGSSQYVMKPRMQTETHNKQDKAEKKVISEWEDATSIVERCAVE